jgi:hypothetical protein
MRATLDKKPYKSIDEFLSRNNLYAIESIVDQYTRYVISDDRFAIMRKNDALICDINEMIEMAEFFNEDIKEEIIGLYEDALDLKRMDVDYSQVIIGGYDG